MNQRPLFDDGDTAQQELEEATAYFENIDEDLRELSREHKILLGQPPLELGPGHLALLIASGQLAGKVEQPGEKPHVMRGIVEKVLDNNVERVKITIRTIDSDGVIEEYS